MSTPDPHEIPVRLFELDLPSDLDSQETQELLQALEGIGGVQVIQENSRGVIEEVVPNLTHYVVLVVATGVVGMGLDAVHHPIKYLKNNSAKLKEMTDDLHSIIQTWTSKGDTTKKERATLKPAPESRPKAKTRSKAKKFKDVTQDDLKNAIEETDQD